MLAWLMQAPLGIPVVPDVKEMYTVSDGEIFGG